MNLFWVDEITGFDTRSFYGFTITCVKRGDVWEVSVERWLNDDPGDYKVLSVYRVAFYENGYDLACKFIRKMEDEDE